MQVSRALRIPELAETNIAWPAWTSQLLSAYQQRDHIVTAGASDKPPAFIFDIDGVLIRGKKVLEPAKIALHRLYRDEGTDVPDADLSALERVKNSLSDPTLAMSVLKCRR